MSDGEPITINRHGCPVARLALAANEPPSSVATTVERLRHVHHAQTLEGLCIGELRDQGRR